MYLKVVKDMCDKPTANTIVSDERLEAFPLNQEQDAGNHYLLFNIVLEVLARTIRQEK